ncbi:flagellar hook-associated protein FlgK [Salidesulfovibrio onnuriiensis]|uniref:flagellar hook-associated protein FlgK n=1 Tax=Salidesulfovibrio onnuriiensis TaxID=2583823 RepID=UPI0011CCBAF9|nr:flagellar hook-associated protein FlgK [Salidesulfovibrio onnuriiensis]
MAFGANSILDVGRWALFASQVQLSVTGQNISNVNTEGYSRRSAVLEEGINIDYKPGQMGTGVQVKEITRHFDELVERLYYDQASLSEKWGELYEQLQSVESLFNESSGIGISDSMSSYFSSWNDLSQRADHYGTRQDVVNKGSTLASTLVQADTSLANMQERIDAMIQDEVNTANTIMQQIAEVNRKINIQDDPGTNNANSLYDERARLVRELGTIVDINYIDNGKGNVTITTKAGQNLVDGEDYFSFEFGAPWKEKELHHTSPFEGQVYYEGESNFEYTLEFVESSAGSGIAGLVGSGANAAQFKVSLDGGKTWLTNDDGTVRLYNARPNERKVEVEGVNIWFGSDSSPLGSSSGNLLAGDRFIIRPSRTLYWVENTSSKQNVTPQADFTGAENEERVTGGKLGALFALRDQYIGKYRKKLDTLAEGLIWEVNRVHSQGAGLQKFNSVEGTYSVDAIDRALASDSTGLVYGDKLASGSSYLYIYNKNTGALVSNAALDFDPATPGTQTFNPDVHTLADVRDAYNDTFGSFLTASIVDNRLRLSAKDGYEMSFGADTSGLNAALGFNCFYQGQDAGSIEVNDMIATDLDYLAAGHVNGAGETNAGDNYVALAMFALREAEVSLSTPMEGTTNQTLLEYYNGLVGNVGADTNNVKFNKQFTSALAQDLDDRQQQVSGVNLDEEMSNLIKYQHSYTAAAKLITTADQMLQTVLSLKP